MSSEKWNSLMHHFQFKENHKELDYLTKMYNGTDRAYHNLNHINDCLNKLDQLNEVTPIENKPEIALAFWFHDVIYDPFRKDNELKSAERAKSFLEKQGADFNTIEFVYDLILATIHKEQPKNISESYVMDIDISILGSDPKTYQTYCNDIRKEYKMVPGILYKRNRAKIMKSFLNRTALYYTAYYREKYEAKARTNIANEISNL